MVSLLDSMVENTPLGDMAKSWGVSPEQAARRVRDVPFVVLDHPDSKGGGRGRPGRRLALNPHWRFPAHSGKAPLRNLLRYLRTLHRLGEPFALGVPFTSTFWRPFLNPEVRLLAPPATFSLWQRLFAGRCGTLTVVVELLPGTAKPVEAEGLPLLDPAHAAVDAVLEYQRMPNLNILALADWLAHVGDVLPAALPFAMGHGVDRDIQYLEDHRRQRGARVVRPEELREAHRRALKMARVPAKVRFQELVAREAYSGD